MIPQIRAALIRQVTARFTPPRSGIMRIPKNTSGIARLRLIQWDNGQTRAAGDRRLWTIYINGHVPQIASVPISDHAITLDEAASQSSRVTRRCGRRRAAKAAAVRSATATAEM